jgi:hypothetical protein
MLRDFANRPGDEAKFANEEDDSPAHGGLFLSSAYILLVTQNAVEAGKIDVA